MCNISNNKQLKIKDQRRLSNPREHLCFFISAPNLTLCRVRVLLL